MPEPITTKEAVAILKDKLSQWLSEKNILAYLKFADPQGFTDKDLLIGQCQSYWAHKLEDAGYWNT